jgi:hypothetical protein
MDIDPEKGRVMLGGHWGPRWVYSLSKYPLVPVLKPVIVLVLLALSTRYQSPLYVTDSRNSIRYQAFACYDLLDGGKQKLSEYGVWTGDNFGLDAKGECIFYSSQPPIYTFRLP